jgi:hypothetical protein
VVVPGVMIMLREERRRMLRRSRGSNCVFDLSFSSFFSSYSLIVMLSLLSAGVIFSLSVKFLVSSDGCSRSLNNFVIMGGFV